MPLSAAAAALISAGGNMLGQAVGGIATGSMNRKTRKWTEKMYEKQKADNLAFWNTQNAYNAPDEQMARLKAAGLNPNLVYGNGADVTAGSIQGADVKQWSPETPKFDIGAATGAGLSAYQDARMRDVQIDNIKAQTDLSARENALKAAQTLNVLADTDLKGQNIDTAQWELMFKQGMADYDFAAKDASVRKQEQDLILAAEENTRAWNRDSRDSKRLSNETNHLMMQITTAAFQNAKTAEETAEVKHRIHNLEKTGALQDLEIAAKKAGYNTSDPAYQQALKMLWNGEGIFSKNHLDRVGSNINKFTDWFKNIRKQPSGNGLKFPNPFLKSY